MKFTEFAARLEQYKPGPSGWQDRRDRASHHIRLTIAGLGLMTEAAEAVDYIKKHLESGKPIDRARLSYELGDVLHYLTDIAIMAGINPDLLLEDHLNKLHTRFGPGYSDSKLAAKRDELNGSDDDLYIDQGGVE